MRVTLSRAHHYTLDKRHAPGVTTILDEWNKPGLNRWKVNVQQDADIAVAWKLLEIEREQDYWIFPRQVPDDEAPFIETFKKLAGREKEHQKQSREAKDLGSQMHALLEDHWKRTLGIPYVLPPVSDEAQALFSGVLHWIGETQLRPIAVERRVFSLAGWYCGTVDLFAEHEGRRKVVDYKSAKGDDETLWPEQRCQNAAYREAARGMGMGEWGGLIIKVPKNGAAPFPVPVTSDPAEDFAAFLACLTLYRFGKK